MTGVPVHFCVWKEEEFDDIRAFCEEKIWDYKDYRLYLYYVNHNLNEISFQTSVRMEFSQVSNKESVENRSKACAKPKGLNFIFNKYFRFPDLRFKNYLLQWLFISQGSERKDVDQWWGKFNSPSYFDKLLR